MGEGGFTLIRASRFLLAKGNGAYFNDYTGVGGCFP